MSPIRVLLVGVAGMLNDIVRAAVSAEPDITIVGDAVQGYEQLCDCADRLRIDVAIYPAASAEFHVDSVVALLHANPRLSLLAIDGQRDAGTLHHLVPAHDAIGRLTQSCLTAAIRAGAALRAP